MTSVVGDRWRVTVLTAHLVRIEYAASGRFEDRPTQVVVRRDLGPVEAQVTRVGEGVEIRTDGLELRWDGGPPTAMGLSVTARGGISNYRSTWRYGEPLRTLGGTARTLDEADGRIPLEPGICSRDGITVLDDSHSLVVDADGQLHDRDGSEIDLYVFAHGRDYRAALADYHALTGPVPLVPRWVLGTWWSRYHPYSADEYLTLLDRFAAERIPLSVAVLDMDWHVTDVDPRFGSGWTGYTWERRLFPDPPAFLAELHRRGLRVTLNDHPADGVRAHESAYPAMASALGIDPETEAAVTFDVADAAYLDALFEHVLRPMEQDGVDFWWLDWQQGRHSRRAGLDPLWELNRRHFAWSGRDGRRPLIFSRYAGPGSHRHPLGFSGDTVVSWESLDFQPEFTATAANIGYGWWSHDIGGHMFGARDDELYARWVQLGVFSPVCRLHATASPFQGKEPWRYRGEVRAVVGDALRLRHRLVPYLYTMAERASREGRPLVEPLYHEHPWAEAAYQHPNEFRFGTELLVAPITAPRCPVGLVARVDAWLPEGDWFDVLTGFRYAGDRTIALWREVDAIPVLARAGAIVPLAGAGPDDDAVLANGTEHPEAIELLLGPGADGRFTLYEDDGASEAALRAARTPIEWQWQDRRVVIGPLDGSAGVVPERRSWVVHVLGIGTVTARASVDGQPVTCESTGTRRVIVRDVPVGARLEVGLLGVSGLAANPVGTAFDYLDRTQISFSAKEAAWRIVSSADRAGDPARAVPELLAIDLPESVLGRLVELLTAAG